MKFTGGTEPTVPMRVYAKTYEEIKKVSYEQHIPLPEALHRIIQGACKEGSESEIIQKLKEQNKRYSETLEDLGKKFEQYIAIRDKREEEMFEKLKKLSNEAIKEAFNRGVEFEKGVMEEAVNKFLESRKK